MLFTAPIEATLTVVIDPSTPSILTDEMLITSLKKRGPLTIEALAAESGMSWAQMFSAVDRLSRAGTVSCAGLAQAYQVAYHQAAQS